MMAMSDITDSESYASDVQTQFPDIREQADDLDEITDAAAAKSNDNDSMPLIAQPEEGPTMDKNDWNGERLIFELFRGPNNKI
eukprot:6968136-Pyramimonas_sp.AAC.1